jgi:hypothetical protein
VTYTGHAAVAQVEDVFIPAVSPGTAVQITDNQFYASREEFLVAVADAMHVEYQAIVDGGFDLRVDACDLAMDRSNRIWLEFDPVGAARWADLEDLFERGSRAARTGADSGVNVAHTLSNRHRWLIATSALIGSRSTSSTGS